MGTTQGEADQGFDALPGGWADRAWGALAMAVLATVLALDGLIAWRIAGLAMTSAGQGG